jgi:hypothetical protein
MGVLGDMMNANFLYATTSNPRKLTGRELMSIPKSIEKRALPQSFRLAKASPG